MNIIESQYKSSLRLMDIFVSKTEFERNDSLPSKLEMSFEFGYEIIHLDEKEFKIILNGKVSSSDKSVMASASVAAFFEYETNADNPKIDEIVKTKNSLAIIFPYLRTQLALVSSQSGKPIVIPAMNINAYIDDKLKEE